MSTPRRRPPVKRSAARLGAVQALYQMDLAGTDVGEVLAQFSARASGDAFEDGQCGPADFSFLKEVVDGVVRLGKPADEVLKIAAKKKADLIVTGAKGLGAIARFLLGSVSTRVVQHSTCSVLVVR